MTTTTIITTTTLSIMTTTTITRSTIHDQNTQKPKDVQLLDVSWNPSLDLVDVDSFSPFSRLKALRLSSNGIRFLHPGSFRAVVRLEMLDLSFNSIVDGGSGLFGRLGRLASLNLSGNRFRILDDKVFAGLQSLEELDLSSNRLVGITSRVFADTPRLKKINLAGNRFESVPVYPLIALAGMLKSLSMDDNRIESLPGEIFCAFRLPVNQCGFRNLESLTFDGNRLVPLLLPVCRVGHSPSPRI